MCRANDDATGYYNPMFINYRDRIIIMLFEIFIISLPCLISVVPQIEPVPLLVGVNVQVGEKAEDLLEGEEGGGDSLGLVMNQLLAGHSADLRNKSIICRHQVTEESECQPSKSKQSRTDTIIINQD